MSISHKQYKIYRILENIYKKFNVKLLVSGIVVKYIEKISEEVLDYCNENDFPLFVMPWNIRIPDMELKQLNKIN